MPLHLAKTTTLSGPQKEAIVAIWNEQYPVSIRHEGLETFDAYLAALSNVIHYLLLDADTLAGWFATFDRNDERWFSVIVDGQYQRQGLGLQLLRAAQNDEAVLNGWVTDHNISLKQNGQPYLSPLGFYLKNGFDVLPDVRFENEKLSAVKIRWTKP